MLDDYKLMKEMFNDPAFSGRPQSEIFLGLSEGSYGVNKIIIKLSIAVQFIFCTCISMYQ